jgi:hypothetical protein
MSYEDDTALPMAETAIAEHRAAPVVDEFGEDLGDEPEPLPISARRRRLSAVTAALALAAVGAAGFYAGVVVQKHQKSSGSTATAAAAFASRLGRAGAGAGGAGFAGTGGPNRVAGTVKLIDGSNIYVTDAQGNTVKVATGSGAQFSKTVAGALSDVKIGDRVTVTGPQGADGTYQAQQVIAGGAAGAGRAFGGGGAAAGGAAGG